MKTNGEPAEPGTEPLRQKRHGGEPEPAAADDGMFQALRAAGSEILEIGDHVKRLLEIKADRARINLQGRMQRLLVGGLLAVTGLTVCIAASLYLVAGLTGALAVLFGGRGWAGDLAGGAILLGAIWGGAALALARGRRSQLKRLAEKYRRPERGKERSQTRREGVAAP